MCLCTTGNFLVCVCGTGCRCLRLCKRPLHILSPSFPALFSACGGIALILHVPHASSLTPEAYHAHGLLHNERYEHTNFMR